MFSGKKIVYSTVLLSAGQLVNLALNVGITVLIARSLGEEKFGYFSWLIACLNIVAMLPDFGMGPIVLREISRDRSRLGALLGTVLVLRTALLGIAWIGFNAFALVEGFGPETIGLMNIMILNVIVSSKLTIFRYTLEAVFRSQLRMSVPVVLSVLDNLLLLMGVLLLIDRSSPVVSFVVLYTVCNVPGFLALAYMSIRSERIRFSFDRALAHTIVRASAPLGLYVAILALYANVDVLLLRALRGNGDVGIYSAALRFALPLMFIPGSVVGSLFPSLSAYAGQGNEKLTETFAIGLKVVVVLGVGVAVFGLFAVDHIMPLLYGDQYNMSGGPLKLLLWSMLFFFVNFLLSNVNIAMGRQSVNVVYALLVCVASIGLNLALIPGWSAVGASASRLICETIGCGFLILSVRRNIAYPLGRLAGKIVLLGGAFSLLLWLIQGNLPLLIIGGGAGFILLVSVTRVFDRTERSRFRLAFMGGR